MKYDYTLDHAFAWCRGVWADAATCRCTATMKQVGFTKEGLFHVVGEAETWKAAIANATKFVEGNGLWSALFTRHDT